MLDFIESLLTVLAFILIICGGCIISALTVHSSVYDQWKWNFSKKGLKYHLTTYGIFMFIGAGFMFLASKIKEALKR